MGGGGVRSERVGLLLRHPWLTMAGFSCSRTEGWRHGEEKEPQGRRQTIPGLNASRLSDSLWARHPGARGIAGINHPAAPDMMDDTQPRH